MTPSARSGHLIPAIITWFCAVVLIVAVSWLTQARYAAQTDTHGGAGTTAHVIAGPPWTSGTPSPPPPSPDGPPWT